MTVSPFLKLPVRTEREVRAIKMSDACPFCGAEAPLASMRYINGKAYYMVGCENEDCVISPSAGSHNLEEAWAMWRTRK